MNAETEAAIGRQPPLLTIVIHPDGGASVGGVPVPVDGDTDITGIRAAAMVIALRIVSEQGVPVRAVAFEPDGAVWPLIIHPDGHVDEDPGRDIAAMPLPESAHGSVAPPALTLARPREDTEGASWSNEGNDGLAVQEPEAPEPVRDRLRRISAAGEAGQIEAAASMAMDLESTVVGLYGEAHPHVLQARAVRAHIAALAQDWPRAADLYLHIAEAWMRKAGAPSSQVRRNAANAHVCWTYVSDQREALRIGEAVTLLWSRVPGAGDSLRRAGRRLRLLRRSGTY
ncbi:hypothetical protein [Streptomyces sp. PU-14G]|uniref:hypothetical protein n=1 Tax=Streptomyces sp. PU-14G TaxID=2800808 RepID=UPI0034DE244D